MIRNPSQTRTSEVTPVASWRVALVVVVCDQDPQRTVLRSPRPPDVIAQRALDYLASRRAQQIVAAVLGYHPERGTAPASLAHAAGAGACAAAVAPYPSGLLGVGVDLEPVRTASARTARFYLDVREEAWLAGVSPSDEWRSEQQLRLWTTKEALFKADPDNHESTLRDYRLLEPAAEAGGARRNTGRSGGNNPVFGYIHTRIADLHLSVAVAVGKTEPEVPDGWQRRTVSDSTITFDAVAERISAVLSIPPDRLTPETTLADLAADSFLLVELVVDLQEEFDAIFTQAELRQVRQLGELVTLLEQHAGGASGAAGAAEGQSGH